MRCGMYFKENKNWTARVNESPPIVEAIESFKEYLANTITLVNQSAILAANHGYSMAAVDKDAVFTSYGDSHANVDAMYAATQESIKNQATSLAAMQGQLANIQQFCLAIGQQPPSNGYNPVWQQHTSTSHHNQHKGGGSSSNGGNGSCGFPQQLTMFSGNGAGAQQSTCPPTPYKVYENWNYCHTYDSNINKAHTSAMCENPGPMHNSTASCTNFMGGLIAGMHMAILL
jgi:hypothetical protein